MAEKIGLPKSILERLQQEAQGRNVVFTAIEKLKTPQEIQQFRAEYEAHIKAHGTDEKVRQKAAEVANGNIRYVLGYYPKETAEKRFGLLEQVSHPVFGRSLPYGQPEKAFAAGVLAGVQVKQGAK